MPQNHSRNTVYEISNISKTYHMGDIDVHALRGIDLTLYESEFVVLLGHSGSGKSTLLNIIGGLDRPSSGSVLYRGHDLCSFNEAAVTRYRREKIGFVFQFYNIIPSLTAIENIALVAEISNDPFPPEEALRMVGLENRKNHFPSQLSGGEQQRIAIARALVKKPDVLLCDEPTGALDVKTGAKVLQVIETVNKELGTTTVVITHNAIIASMADTVITVADGQISNTIQNTSKLRASELVW